MSRREDRHRERMALRRAEVEAPWARDGSLERMLKNAAWLAFLSLKVRPSGTKFESRFFFSDEAHGDARPVVGPSVVAWRETLALVGIRDEGRLVLARVLRSSVPGSYSVFVSTGRHEADVEFMDVDDLRDHAATSGRFEDSQGVYVGVPFFLADMVREEPSGCTRLVPRWADRVRSDWDRGGWRAAMKDPRRNPREEKRRLERRAARGDVRARRRLLPAWVNESRLAMLGKALVEFESLVGEDFSDLVVVAWEKPGGSSLSHQRRWRRAIGGPGSPIIDGFVILPLDVEWGPPVLAATFGPIAFAAAAFCRSPWLGEGRSESVALFVPDGAYEEDDPADLAVFLREEAGAESFLIDRRLIP